MASAAIIARGLGADEELALMLFDKLPKEFRLHRELLISRLWRSPETWKLASKLSH